MQGLLLCLLHWQADSLPLVRPGMPKLMISPSIHSFKWKLPDYLCLFLFHSFKLLSLPQVHCWISCLNSFPMFRSSPSKSVSPLLLLLLRIQHFYLMFIYLAAPGLSCSMWDLPSSLHLFLSSLQHEGSFSHSLRALVPWPGIKPRPPALGMGSLSHWITRKSLCFLLYIEMSMHAQMLQLWLTLWPCGLYVAWQAPLSMGFSRQEFWSGLVWPSPEDLPDPGIEPTSLTSPVLQADSFTAEPPGKPRNEHTAPLLNNRCWLLVYHKTKSRYAEWQIKSFIFWPKPTFPVLHFVSDPNTFPDLNHNRLWNQFLECDFPTCFSAPVHLVVSCMPFLCVFPYEIPSSTL